MSTDLRGFADVLNNALVAAAITTEIAWPNVVYTPKKGVSYLAPALAGRSRSPLGFGADGVMQWTGSYQVSVFVPRDSGTREQEGLASRVMAAFPRGLNLTTTQSIRVIITNSSADAPIAYGDWSNMPVTISWFATEP